MASTTPAWYDEIKDLKIIMVYPSKQKKEKALTQ